MTAAFFTLICVLLYKAVRDCGYQALPPITFNDCKTTPVNQLSGGIVLDKWIRDHISRRILDAPFLYKSWDGGL